MLPAIRKTEREKQLSNVVLAIRELKQALLKTSSAKFFCAHASNLAPVEDYINKINKDIKDMINFLDKIYKSAPIAYNDVRNLYESLETVVEAKSD